MGFLVLIQVAFADVPRDLSFFILGAIAYRRQWFLGLRENRPNLAAVVSPSPDCGAPTLGLGRFFRSARARHCLSHPGIAALLRLASACLSSREAQLPGPLTKAMAEGQYAAYPFHAVSCPDSSRSTLRLRRPPNSSSGPRVPVDLLIASGPPSGATVRIL
jgi:hypothetical protein